MKNLYKAQGVKYNSPDPVRGISGYPHYTNDYVVVAESKEEAEIKFKAHLKEEFKYNNWELSHIEELKSKTNVPLEVRVAIISEFLPIVN